MSDLSHYLTLLDALWQQPVFGLTQKDKEAQLLPIFQALHQHHSGACPPYGRISSQHECFTTLADIPYLAVRLFKHLELKSIEDNDVFKVLRSSGTTGQTPATVYLDRDTSSRQSKALVKIMQHSIGMQRLPMLIIDSPSVLKDKHSYSARGAGIQGLAFFGRHHTYALDENMQPSWPVIHEFVEKYAEQPILVFGFTFMLWKHFIQQLEQQNIQLNLPQAIVLHSGGWKKLEAEKVDNQHFKQTIRQLMGAEKVINFYGMAEQVGSIFTECPAGHLHAPLFADILVRDPLSMDLCEVGQSGLLQVLSVLPTSYPGFSLLTEDLGTCLGIDDCSCGQKGRYFQVEGRIPKSEVRGCSDTHQGV